MDLSRAQVSWKAPFMDLVVIGDKTLLCSTGGNWNPSLPSCLKGSCNKVIKNNRKMITFKCLPKLFKDIHHDNNL